MKNTFELEHVGINTDNAGEAEQLALLLCKLFNLEPRHGQKSEFAGNYFWARTATSQCVPPT